jgi:predicted nucleotidyltransferase
MTNLSPTQLQCYIASAQERDRDRLAKLEERRRSGLSLAKRAASLLKEEFGATQVILFGSLLTETFHESWDIDLAVMGLPEKQYFQAVGCLIGLGNFDFDLVEIQHVRPEIVQKICQGVIL